MYSVWSNKQTDRHTEITTLYIDIQMFKNQDKKPKSRTSIVNNPSTITS